MTARAPKINTAMVLAAGRGERLRPLTDNLPKPLLEVGGKALIDHVLDRLAEAGVDRAVVNLWHLGALIEAHLAGRARPRVTFSPEAELMNTGGGVAQALPLLGSDPFYVINGKILWRDGARGALARLADAWPKDARDGAMDGLLLLVPLERAGGYSAAGDFFLGGDGAIERPEPGGPAPWVFTGIQILHPRLFADAPPGPFSLNLLYDRAMAAGRLFGLAHDGLWHHVATAQGLAEAQAWFAR
jgi:MurNAc alpha-1-phosphate uridylyltransferase